MLTAKRRVRKNIYGNYVGYYGTRRAEEFGADEIAAAYWLFTGQADKNAAYEDVQTMKAIARLL